MASRTTDRVRLVTRPIAGRGLGGNRGWGGGRLLQRLRASTVLQRLRAVARSAASRLGSGPQPPARTSPVRTYVTVRGALVALFALCLVTCLIAAWRQFDVLAGLGYFAGCLAAPVCVRREAQLQIVIAPPVVFLLAVLLTQVLTAQGSSSHGSMLSVVEGTFLMLAGTAPWLFAGAAGCIAVAMFRGLPGCVREFRADFRGERKSGSWHRAAS